MIKMFLRCWLLTLALLLAAPPADAATCDAAAFVASAGKAFDRAARSGSAAGLASAIDRFADMNAIAMFSLGRYRGTLPKAREREYVALTRAFMGTFMLEYGADLRAGNLKIVDCSGPPSATIVNAQLDGGGRMSFKVYRAGGGWQVRDMKVRGIWLVQQMRSNFVGTISRGGGDIDELFKYLRS